MPIALLTDFGLSDAYVGTLKGVLANLAPQTPVIDIAHGIPPYDIGHAALLLYQSYRYFPKKTIFVTVVDPGVGSTRKPILVETEDYYFIGPDNGLFTLVLSEQKIRSIIYLNQEKFFLHPVSTTFHGRDIFSPIAAQVASGISPEKLGEPISSLNQLPEFLPKIDKEKISGIILSIDRFGNAITNLSKTILEKKFPTLNFRVKIGGVYQLKKLTSHYALGKRGKPLLVISSSGLLEICINQGSAAKKLNLKSGMKVTVT